MILGAHWWSSLSRRGRIRGIGAALTLSHRLQVLARKLRLRQFAKFCLVGGSGVVVDMALPHVLARECGWNVSLSKVCAAAVAMLNNFLWNELWTFRVAAREHRAPAGVFQRLGRFYAICGAGLGLAVLLLHMFHCLMGLNLYAANFLAILLVTLWNFWLNARFNWRASAAR